MSKTFDLSSVVYPIQNGTIKVVAVDSTATYRDSDPATMSEVYPTQIVPTPTAQQVSVSGKTMTIDTSASGATYNKITLSNDNNTGSGEYPVSQTSVDLSTITDSEGEALPLGTYAIGVQGEKAGQAVSASYNAGNYTKSPNYLCFTANTAGSTVSLTKTGSPAWSGSYSTDGSTWVVYTPNTTGAITLTSIGDKVYFKGDISANFSTANFLQFVMTGSISASGNCNSMYTSNDFDSLTTLTYQFCYCKLFLNCSVMTTAPDLPATILSNYCYYQMFFGCTSLTSYS